MHQNILKPYFLTGMQQQSINHYPQQVLRFLLFAVVLLMSATAQAVIDKQTG
jgi:hypothetical protein